MKCASCGAEVAAVIERYGFTILGRPRSKGNNRRHIQVGDKLVPIPSKAYQDWLRPALLQANVIKAQAFKRGSFPITAPVRVRAVFYRDRNNAADLDNMEKGAGDFLQRAGIITNDRRILSWGDSRLDVDKGMPRIEFIIEVLEGT